MAVLEHIEWNRLDQMVLDQQRNRSAHMPVISLFRWWARRPHCFAGAKSPELAGHETVSRLMKVADTASIVGLMDLLGFEKDAEELSAFISLLAVRFRRELCDVAVDRKVEEPYDVQETYSENIVIRPGGLFRKERTQLVRKVRTVRKTRTVRRPIKEQRNVWVNGLGDVFSDIGEEWILVPPGTFIMERYIIRGVTITRPFLMQATPVTQAQWEAIMGNNPSKSHKNADAPVENVSWFDAIAYCNALSRTEGLEEVYIIDGGSSVRWKGARRARIPLANRSGVGVRLSCGHHR